MNTIPLKLLCAGALLAAAGTAHAGPIYRYALDASTDPIHHNDVAGEITAVTTAYDTNAQRFSWSYDIDDTSEDFWLVVNDGPNPKNEDARELAILFGDLDERRLTAYVYNGQNNSNSIDSPGIFLESFADAIDVVDPDPNTSGDTRTVSFSIDASRINERRGTDLANGDVGADWRGIGFGPQIGIWFHPTAAGSSFTYDGEGRITSFVSGRTGWLDNSGQNTSTVPEPDMLYLAGIGLLAFALSQGLVRMRRRLSIEAGRHGCGAGSSPGAYSAS